MDKSWLIPAGALALAALTAGCSSVPYAQRVQQRQAAYAAAAGAPVRSFNYFSLYSWEPLSDTELAVYTRPNQAYLLDLGGCQVDAGLRDGDQRGSQASCRFRQHHALTCARSASP